MSASNEYHEQVALVQWLSAQHPTVLFTISPNGMKLPIGVAVKLKRMGYRKGTPDIHIFEARKGYNGLHIELKVKGGNISDEQRWFLEDLNNRGYKAVVAWGFNQAVEIINSYLS